MLFVTPLFLLLALFVMWAFFKSITRFKTQYLWYRHSRRPNNQVCRTIVSHQPQRQQRQGSAVISQQTICTHQCPQHHTCQVPHNQYPRTQNSTNAYQSNQQLPVITELTIPYNCYVPPYYNPHQYQYYDPPPTYPGLFPASQSDPNVPRDQQPTPNILYPTAPPITEAKE